MVRVCLLKSLKQIIAEIPNSVLYVYHMQILLKMYYEDRMKNLCTGAHKKFEYFRPYGWNIVLVHFIIF